MNDVKVALSGIVAGIKLAEKFPNIQELLKNNDKDTANFLKNYAENLLFEVATAEEEEDPVNMSFCGSTEE